MAGGNRGQLSAAVSECHRAHRPRWLGTVCATLLARWGWRVEGEIPGAPKLVLVVGPHTSNWDFVVGVTAMVALDLDIHWIGKHTLFKPPFRAAMTWLGGIPVNRAAPDGFAEQVVARLRDADRIMLAITPEGTRSKVARLKTGFSRIAGQTPCPILPITLDYRRRLIELHPVFSATQDPDADAGTVREIFARAVPRVPEKF